MGRRSELRWPFICHSARDQVRRVVTLDFVSRPDDVIGVKSAIGKRLHGRYSIGFDSSRTDNVAGERVDDAIFGVVLAAQFGPSFVPDSVGNPDDVIGDIDEFVVESLHGHATSARG